MKNLSNKYNPGNICLLISPGLITFIVNLQVLSNKMRDV